MRFDRIDLDYYGCFTKHSITLGPASPDGDFHIIFGPNEAGKSTLRDACIDFLYGFENLNKYNFLHNYKILQVSAAVSTLKGHYEGRRKKRDKDSFLTLDDAPISDAWLKAVLGDVSRSGFKKMFSLDDTSIETGAEDILQSKGDLGKALFAAASGLPSLSARLEVPQAKADGFYKSSRQSLGLNTLKEKLKNIDTELQQADTVVNAYLKLKSNEASARELHETARSERDLNARRIDKLKTILTAAEFWDTLQEDQKQLEAFADAPDIPKGWHEEAKKLVAEEASACRALKENRAAVARTTSAQEALNIDHKALEIAAAVNRLSEDSLEARFRTSVDIETLGCKLQTIETDIRALLGRLGRPDEDDPKQLIITAAEVGQIRELIEQHGTFAAHEKSASDELDIAKKRQQETQAAVQENAEVSDLSAFAQPIGDPSALIAMEISEKNDIQHLKTEAREIKEIGNKLEGKIERLKNEQVLLNAEIASLTESGGIVEESEARTVRARRSDMWTIHREGLDADPPQAIEALRESGRSFEVAMMKDDEISAARLSQTSEFADLRRARTALAISTAELAHTEEKLDDLQKRAATHVEETAAFFTKLGAPPELQLDAVDLWLERLKTARAKARDLVKADRDAGKAVTQRQKVHQRTKEALAQWSADWSAVVGATWIDNEKSAVVKEILKEVDSLTVELGKANDLRGRIEGMTADRAAYRTRIRQLATDAAEPYGDDEDPLAIADRLRLRIDAAEEGARTRKKLEEELKNAEKRRLETQDEVDRIARRITEMQEVIPADSLENLINEMQRSEKKTGLETGIARLKETIQKGLGVISFAEARKMLEEHIPSPEALDEIHEEYSSLMGAQSDKNDRVSELFHEWGEAKKALTAIGDDDQAVRLKEQREALLLEIAQKSHDFMRLSAGIMLVNKALHSYREIHRSSMMKKASEAFVQITKGAFKELSTTTSGKTEVLIGIRANSSTIVVSEMSRGTRFQLYLALRIAGYEEFAKKWETLPFFADDILEPFDDDRSAETFSLLHEMSRHGQVVYLTHHKHLYDIAQSVCGEGITLHKLPDRAL